MKKEFILNTNNLLSHSLKLKEALDENFLDKYTIDYSKNLLSIDLSSLTLADDLEALFNGIKSVIPECDIIEKEVLNTKRRVLILDGLDCANCAAKIERIAKRELNNDFLSVDFATSRFIIETSDEHLLNSLKERVKEITDKVDSGIVVKSASEENKEEKKDFKISKLELIMFITGCACFAVAVPLKYILAFYSIDIPNWLYLIMCGIAYVVLGYDVLIKAFKNIISGRIFDENFLMSLATIVALAIGYYTEAVSVMIFYKIGEVLQEIAVNKSRRSIQSLVNIRPTKANLVIDDKIIQTDPNDIVEGDVILVKTGERIPLDGAVVGGKAALDTSALTGESKYLDVEEGSNVISGAINTNGTLLIKVSKVYTESMVSKILNLVENANVNKAKTEKFISKFAKYYTPAVCLIAIFIAIIPVFYKGSTWNEYQDSIHNALIILVVSCPCALVISIPLGYFGGIGGASKKGILIKGSNYLESLSDVGLVAFDKTGTITTGLFHVDEIVSFEENREEDILKYAAYAEISSNHPIAKSVIDAYGFDNIDTTIITINTNTSKYGARAYINDIDICVGNEKHFDKMKIKTKKVESDGVVLYVAENAKTIGYIVVKDTIRSDAKDVINNIKEMKIRTAMITGDKEIVASKVAKEVGIDDVYAEVMPIEKVKKLRKLKKTLNGKKEVFVGDGINDAPVLSMADVGVAMGKLGSDAAIEVADVVLMNDDLSKLPLAIKIAKKTKKVIVENIVFALAVKTIVMIIVAFNLLVDLSFAMFLGIFADVGVTLLAIINSLRSSRVK